MAFITCFSFLYCHVFNSLLSEYFIQNLQSIFFSPVKCFIQFFNTSDEWFSVTENEIWNQDSHCIHSHGFNSCEVSFCNVLRTMDLDSCFIDFFLILPPKISGWSSPKITFSNIYTKKSASRILQSICI